MKYTVGLVMAVAAISANAQAFNDLPDCGKTCVQNVMAKADEFGCEAGDAACLCQNVNFTYGIRDCSLQSCTDAAQAVINYGAEYCRNEGVVITTAGSDTKTGDSTDATATATVTGGSSDSDSDDDDDAKNGVPIATSTYETVVEESGSSVTSTIVETIYSSSSADAAESTSDSTSEGDSKSATDKDSASKTESKKPTDTNGSNAGNDDDDNSDDDDANEGDDDSGVARAAPAGLLAVAAIAAFLV